MPAGLVPLDESDWVGESEAIPTTVGPSDLFDKEWQRYLDSESPIVLLIPEGELGTVVPVASSVPKRQEKAKLQAATDVGERIISAGREIPGEGEHVVPLFNAPVTTERTVETGQEAAKSAIETAKTSIEVVAGVASFVSENLGETGPAQLFRVTQSAGLQTVALAADVVALAQDGHRYRELSQELEELTSNLEQLQQDGKKDSIECIACEKRIGEIQDELKVLRGQLLENSLCTTSSLVETVAAVTEAVLEYGQRLGLSARTVSQGIAVLEVAAPVVGGVTGTIGIVLNGIELSKNIATDTEVTASIEELKREIATAVSPLKDILEMRLKNLEFQREENLINTETGNPKGIFGENFSSLGHFDAEGEGSTCND